MASTVDTIRSTVPAALIRRARSFVPRPRSVLHRWLVALLAVAVALVISLLLRAYIERTVFVFFFLAITVAAWYSGLAPGLVAAAISLLATDYWLVQPIGRLVLDGDKLVMFLALGGTAAFISWLTNSLAETRATLALHAEQLEEQAGELEMQMEETQKLSTELESSNIELVRSAQQAQIANQAKTDFLAVMSHELRTPLNAIIGYVDLLHSEVSGPMTDTQQSQLARIRSSSFHLLDLIQDILSFSRIEAGREELQISEFDVVQLAHDVRGYVAPQCEQKGIEHRLRLPAPSFSMRSDYSKLKQILINLLGNACKFTDHGFVELVIERVRDDVVFTVSDTGPGISPEHLQMIFEPFTQVDQSKTRLKGGTGLGLSVARRLAHLLGGELQVLSKPGRGSTFTVQLPLQPSLEVYG